MNQAAEPTVTFFAPAGRDLAAELERKSLLLRNAPLLQQTLDTMSDVVLILNVQRQVVGANQALLQMYAEAGDLEPNFKPVETRAVLEQLRAFYTRHPVAWGRVIELSDVWKGSLVTDERLLRRVLGNMLKNALEGTKVGGQVTVSCREQGTQVVFSVHNAQVMPQEVQLQVFQRSFSTKAKLGRGIGTHSMKLLGERYLGGQVAFSSCESAGTTFTLTLPKIACGRP